MSDQFRFRARRNGGRGAFASRILFFISSSSYRTFLLRPSRQSSRRPSFTLGVALIRGFVLALGRIFLVAFSHTLHVLAFKPIVYNDCLLIVQGQRQYINGLRIKWQQRGVVEHNPSWSNTAGMRRVQGNLMTSEEAYMFANNDQVLVDLDFYKYAICIWDLVFEMLQI